METIDIVVIVAAALASLTKLIDVFSTIARVSVYTEMNPLGRSLFSRFGVKGGCWLTFAFWTLVCAVVAFGIVTCGCFVEKILAVILDCVLVYFNISTGLFNMKGYAIPLTKSMLKFYAWLGKKMRK